jgi:hypothetical protein
MAWYWHRAVAVDLPGDDDHVGLAGYAEWVVQATEERREA